MGERRKREGKAGGREEKKDIYVEGRRGVEEDGKVAIWSAHRLTPYSGVNDRRKRQKTR